MMLMFTFVILTLLREGSNGFYGSEGSSSYSKILKQSIICSVQTDEILILIFFNLVEKLNDSEFIINHQRAVITKF